MKIPKKLLQTYRTLSVCLALVCLSACDPDTVQVRGNFGGASFHYSPAQRRPAAYQGRVANSQSVQESNAPAQPVPNQPISHHSHVRRILTDIQNKLIPLAGVLINDTIVEDLGALCHESTPSQKGNARRALLLMIDDDFLAEIREHGGPRVMASHLKAAAIQIDPSLADNSCLLGVIDEVVRELLTNPLNQ